MPTPPPPKSGRFGNGYNGNPNGGSRKARFRALLKRRIKELGVEQPLVDTWIAMALGKKDLLQGREPEYRWFREILDRIDGPVVVAQSYVPSDDRKVPPGIHFPPVDDVFASLGVKTQPQNGNGKSEGIRHPDGESPSSGDPPSGDAS